MTPNEKPSLFAEILGDTDFGKALKGKNIRIFGIKSLNIGPLDEQDSLQAAEDLKQAFELPNIGVVRQRHQNGYNVSVNYSIVKPFYMDSQENDAQLPNKIRNSIPVLDALVEKNPSWPKGKSRTTEGLDSPENLDQATGAQIFKEILEDTTFGKALKEKGIKICGIKALNIGPLDEQASLQAIKDLKQAFNLPAYGVTRQRMKDGYAVVVNYSLVEPHIDERENAAQLPNKITNSISVLNALIDKNPSWPNGKSRTTARAHSPENTDQAAGTLPFEQRSTKPSPFNEILGDTAFGKALKEKGIEMWGRNTLNLGPLNERDSMKAKYDLEQATQSPNVFRVGAKGNTYTVKVDFAQVEPYSDNHIQNMKNIPLKIRTVSPALDEMAGKKSWLSSRGNMARHHEPEASLQPEVKPLDPLTTNVSGDMGELGRFSSTVTYEDYLDQRKKKPSEHDR